MHSPSATNDRFGIQQGLGSLRALGRRTTLNSTPRVGQTWNPRVVVLTGYCMWPAQRRALGTAGGEFFASTVVLRRDTFSQEGLRGSP